MIQLATTATPSATAATAAMATTPAPLDPAETERLGDEIAELAAHLHAATYRLLVLLRAFDEREGWGGGFRSCADWLSWRTGIAPGAAREKVRVARALAELPCVSAEMERGAMSFSKARAITRVATPDNEQELVELARHATAAHIERIVRAWRRVDRLSDVEVEEERHRSRALSIFEDEDGMYVVRGRLEPEVGALLEKALEWAEAELFRRASRVAASGGSDASEEATASEERGPSDEVTHTTYAQRRADAIGLLVECALGTPDAERPHDHATGTADDAPGRASASRRSERYQVVLHIGPEPSGHTTAVPTAVPTAMPTAMASAMASAMAGLRVSAETSRRLACDAGLVLMSHDARGNILDLGRQRRLVPPRLRRALEFRDRGCCRFPGCAVRHTDAHHIRHWADGGPTCLDNLVLLCRFHHRLVHKAGWTVQLADSGDFTFRRPDGRRLPEAPEPPALSADAVTELKRQHAARGITPDARLTTPDWNGERLELGLATHVLRG